ncbi:hypothetical protein ACJJTC_000154 [Scirpophaga incertulas]
MRASLAAMCLVAMCLARAERHGFYRELRRTRGWGIRGSGGGVAGTGRRVFGGALAKLEDFPSACALLDQEWRSVCSCAVVGARWALTAAHCVSPRAALVTHGSARLPPHREGRPRVAAVHSRYRHPHYRVEQRDEGFGRDVTLLHHDVGLVRTRSEMQITPPTPEWGLFIYEPQVLANQEVQVLGFGSTEGGAAEELHVARLRVRNCSRPDWLHCVCAVAAGRDSSAVCAGDSGGPVVYRGVQVGVTSMGPVECSARAGGGSASSVLTALRPYVELVKTTMAGVDAGISTQLLPGSMDLYEASGAPRLAGLAAASLAPALLVHVLARSL